jgi:hypothetical protein
MIKTNTTRGAIGYLVSAAAGLVLATTGGIFCWAAWQTLNEMGTDGSVAFWFGGLIGLLLLANGLKRIFNL